MPAGKMEEIKTEGFNEYKYDNSQDLLKNPNAKKETIGDIINILREKEVILGNLLGIQTAFHIIETSSLSQKEKENVFSTMNLILTMASIMMNNPQFTNPTTS